MYNKEEDFTLYHVSLSPVHQFVLRVPATRSKGENDTIKRICFSDDIVRAVNAIPEFGNIVKFFLELGVDPHIWIYTLRKEQYGLLACKTECLKKGVARCIQKGIYPVLDFLAVSSYVPDAVATHEHWLLSEPHMEDLSVQECVIKDVKISYMKDMYGQPTRILNIRA